MAITIKSEPTEHEPQVGGDHRLNTILRVLQSIEFHQQQYTGTDVVKQDCATIVSQMAALQTPKHKEYKAFCEQILDIQSKLPMWCKDKVVANNMLLAFYQEISTEGKVPSPVLSIVLQLLSPESIQQELLWMQGGKFGVGGLEQALMTLCEWLAKWTITPNLGTLVHSLFGQLKKQTEHIDILSRVTENYLEPLFTLVILRDHGQSVGFVVLQMLSIKHTEFPVLDKVLPRLQQWTNTGCSNKIPRVFLSGFLSLAFEQLKHNPCCTSGRNANDVCAILLPYEKLLKQSEDGSSGSGIMESDTASSSYDLALQQGFGSSNGHVGLHNLGNTCYMNSILQALFMTTTFRNDILVNVKEDAVRTSPLVAQLQQLFALLQYSGSWRRTALEPIGFLSTARPPTFLPGHQHDSSEFLGHLLDALHEQEQPQLQQQAAAAAAASEGAMTAVGRTFSGRTVTRSRCAMCGAQSEHTDHFRDLQLAFPTTGGGSNREDGTTSVQALLDYYLQPEPLTGDNQYHCSHCSQLTDGERCTQILHPPPPRLLLTLKHFRYDPATQLRTKLLQRVQLDQRVKLAVVTPPGGEGGGAMVEYELYAAVVHCGHSLDAGHYYTYAQEGGEDREWYKFNDATVTAAAPTDLLTIPSPSAAYVLFYRRTDMPEPPRLVPSELPERLRNVLQRDRAEAGAMAGNGSSSSAGRGANGGSSTRRPPPGGGSCGGSGLGSNFSRYVY